MMRPTFSLLFAAALLACGRDVDPPRPGPGTVPPEIFAAVVAELAFARVELLPDTGAYRARHDAILAARGVSAEQLRASARSYGRNEDLMEDVYQLVTMRLDSVFGASETAPPTTTVTPPEDLPTAAPDTTAAAPPDQP